MDIIPSYRKPFLFCSTIILSFVFLFFFFPGVSAEAVTVQTGSFNLKVTGEKTWGLKFGMGNEESLSRKNYPGNSVDLNQSLAIGIDGTITPFLKLNVDLNDKRPNYLQKFNLKLDTDDWDGILGDFNLGGKEGFTVYNKEVRGIRVDGRLGRYNLEASLGRVMGISKTKVFYGHSAKDRKIFSYFKDDGEEKKPYRENIEGLYFYPLKGEFVEGFTEPSIQFTTSSETWSFLEEWDLGYLRGEIEKEPSKSLVSGQYKPLSTKKKDYLLLMRKIDGLLRSRLKYYIDLYNSEEKPEEKKRYPFNEGTDYEQEFLKKLRTFSGLKVNKEQISWGEYGKRRYYTLDHSDIKKDTLKVEIKENGEWKDIGDLEGRSYDLFPKKGVLELDLPDSFWADYKNKKVRAKFSYNLSGSVFMLGFSVTPGSEKVYLNGDLLQKNTDYSINYETGSLILFKDISEDDKLKIDYEQARGGIGGYSQYKRNIYGLSLGFETEAGVKVNAEVYQARDMSSDEIPPTISIMPNTKTVAGLEADYKENGWEVGFRLAGSIDRFPPGKNKRKHLPNKINDIAYFSHGGAEYYVFAHQNGITVYDGVQWRSYDASDGLASNQVKDIYVTEKKLYFATNSGITRLRLQGPALFARKENWKSFYESDGLPVEETLSLVADDKYLWVGTEKGLLRGELGKLDTTAGWNRPAEEKLKDRTIGEIERINDQVWLGTDSGLYSIDFEGPQSLKKHISDTEIRDLSSFAGEVYAATEWGVISYDRSFDHRWRVRGREVYGLALSEEGELWYGTKDGFYGTGGAEKYGSGRVTTILATQSEVWAASRGQKVEKNAFDLKVWRLSEELVSFDSGQTGIIGKDEARYENIPSTGNVDRGVFFESNLKKTFEFGALPLSVGGEFSLSHPEYSPIGKEKENDELKWSISLESEVSEELTLSGSRNYKVKNFFSENSQLETIDRAELEYLSLVDLSVLGEVKQVGEASRSIRLESSLSDEIFSGKVAWELGLSGKEKEDLKEGRSQLSAQLDGQLNLNPLPAFKLEIGYSYPLKIEGFSGGNDEFNWKANFSRGVNLWTDYGFNLDLKDEGKLSAPWNMERGSLENKLSAELRFDKVGSEDLSVSPFFSFTWKKKPSGDEYGGKFTSQGTYRGLETRLSVSRKITDEAASKRSKTNDKVSGKLKFGKTELDLPTLDYSIKREIVAHPSYGKKTEIESRLKLSDTLSDFESGEGDYSLSVKYVKGKGMFYSLSNDISWTFSENFTPQLSLTGGYETKKKLFNFGAEVSSSYQISEFWSFSLESGLSLETNELGDFTPSFYGAATLIARF